MVRPWTAGDHVSVSYRNDERAALLAANLAAALGHGERLVYFADSESTEDVAAWLVDERPDVERLVARGQLVVHQATRFAAEPGVLDGDQAFAVLRQEAEAAVRAGYVGARICREMAWALREPASLTRVRTHEWEAGRAIAAGRLVGVRLVCQYAQYARDTVRVDVTAVRRTHEISLTTEQAPRSARGSRRNPAAGGGPRQPSATDGACRERPPDGQLSVTPQ